MSATAQASLVPDPGSTPTLAVPSPRGIRRYTRAAANHHGGMSLSTLLSDVYSAVLMAAIALGTAIGTVSTLRDALPPEPTAAASSGDLSMATLVTLVVLSLVGTTLSLAARLGPVGVGAAEARWWLSLPVPRRGLLRPTAWRLPAVATLTGGPVLLLLHLFAQDHLSSSDVVRTVAGGCLGGGAIVLLAGVAQSVGADRKVVARIGDSLLGLVPVLGVAAVVSGRGNDARAAVPMTPTSLVLVALAVGALVGGVVLDARLDRIPVRELRDSGAVASQAVGAVVSLDSRELGRALGDRMTRSRRRRSSRLAWVSSPVRGLLTADLLLWWRSPRHVVQVVAAAAVPALISAVGRLDTPLALAGAFLVAGYVAMLATAEGARRAEVAPVLDRLLPIGAAQVRRLRMVVPGVLMAVWSLVVLVPVGRSAGDMVGWTLLALLTTPVWAAAAVRSAYRPSPDWTGPLVSTPMGALPPGVATVLVRGPDVVLLGMVPVMIAVGIGRVTEPLLVVQVILGAIAVAVSSRLKPFSLLDLAAQDPAATAAGKPAAKPAAATSGARRSGPGKPGARTSR